MQAPPILLNDRVWYPTSYLDEIMPEGRPSPSAWLCRLADGAHAWGDASLEGDDAWKPVGSAICRELGCIEKPGIPLSFVQDLRRQLSKAHARNGELIRSWDPATPTERQELDRMRRGWGPSSPTERERRRQDVAACLQALSTAMTNLSVGEDEDVPEEAQDRLDLAYERVSQQHTKVVEILRVLVADPKEWPDIVAAEERGAARALSAAQGDQSEKPEVSTFSHWTTNDLAAQCRMQSREMLDPELSRFFTAVSERLLTLSATQGDQPAGDA